MTSLPETHARQTATVEDDALATMRGLIFGFSISRAIAVVAELKIADHLANGACTAAQLATDCGASERPLYRVLRALAGEGVFFENADGSFELTETAELLRSDHPQSLRDWALFVAEIGYRSQLDMLHTVRTGESAFPRQFGMPLFEYLEAHADTKLFRAMSSISAARTSGLLESYDFGRVLQLVDVGGAHGRMAAAIASRYPEIRCICFDLAGAEQGANETFAEAGVAERCRFIAGDFFRDVPAGADSYLLSAILHDWDDHHCVQILRNCRRRIRHTGSLVIVDIVLSAERNVHDTYRNCLDLATMTQIGGMERTESEFRTLLAHGGFELSKVIEMRAPQSILLAHPV